MAMLLYSSGSTGRPKGIVHAHGDILANCAAFAQHVLGLTEDDRTFCTTKLYHTYGLCAGLMYPMYAGATSIILDGSRSPERILRTVRGQRATVFLSVPALYTALVADPDSEGTFDSVRMCVSSAESLPTTTFDLWLERFGLEIIDALGSTEMLHGFCSSRPGEVRRGTIGRPVPGYDLRLTDEADTVLEGPSVGALEVRGHSCASGYWHERDKTMQAKQGDWFVTGDRCERSADGTYVYVGRTDDMFKVGGMWISPIDMENVLREHEAVAAAGVVQTIVSDYSRIAAFVQCAGDVSGDDRLAEALRDWCRGRLRADQYPHVVRFVSALPRTLNGKLERFKLRELAERESEQPDPTESGVTDDEEADPQLWIVAWAEHPTDSGDVLEQSIAVLGAAADVNLEAAAIDPAWIVDSDALGELLTSDAAIPDVVLVPARGVSGECNLAKAALEVVRHGEALLQALLAARQLKDAKFVVLTTRAVAAHHDESPDVVHAPLWGLVRSVQVEHPDRVVVVVDIDDSKNSWRAFQLALAVDEPQIALRDGMILVPRLSVSPEHAGAA